jgi:hypothetical protein
VQPFIASANFAGPKAGYAFKLGPQGVGYYEDRGPCYDDAVPPAHTHDERSAAVGAPEVSAAKGRVSRRLAPPSALTRYP